MNEDILYELKGQRRKVKMVKTFTHTQTHRHFRIYINRDYQHGEIGMLTKRWNGNTEMHRKENTYMILPFEKML